jgi:hypothetical protein
MLRTLTWPWPVAALVLTLGAITMARFPTPATTPGQAAKARYEIELRMEKISGSYGGPNSCPGARRDGSDVMTGIVEGDESAGGSITYEGTLSRATRLEYCENWRPKGEDEFCVPILIGKQARVKVTITTYPPSTNQDAEIKYAPQISNTDSADVKGACTSDMELAIVQEYLEPEGFTIDTANQSPLPRLAKGIWQDVKPRPVTGPDGWTLTVVRKIQ